MPSRSFFEVPDQAANLAILKEYHEAEVEALTRFGVLGVAPLVDEASLARLMGLSQKTIFGIIRNIDSHYRYYPLRKKSGGHREIQAPRTYIKVIQWWILDNILKKLNSHSCVTGFRAGTSPQLNAQQNVGAKHLLNLDLKNFFPSISPERVFAVWRNIGYGDPVAGQLTDLTTLRGALPQGAPTSPSLANIVAEQLDKWLEGEAVGRGYKYTRYADDLTFSSHTRIPDEFISEVQEWIHAAGFEINEKKTRFLSKGRRMEVTGYVVNDRPQLPRMWRKKARAAFHQASLQPMLYANRLNYLRGLYGAVCTFSDDGSGLKKDGRAALTAVTKVVRTLK